MLPTSSRDLPAGGPVLSLQHVTIAYGERMILRSCSCDLPLSGITLLNGRNGAGKSTLLQVVLGIVRPVQGEVLLDGRPVQHMRARLGYMPQGRSHMPGGAEGGLAIPAVSHIRAAVDGARWGVAFGRQKRCMQAVMEQAGIPLGAGSYVRRPLGQLSGGERQRVALAQALAPLWNVTGGVLLLDEPFAALDAAGRAALSALLQQLAANGTAIVLTSHDMQGLETMASRTVTLMKDTLHVCV